MQTGKTSGRNRGASGGMNPVEPHYALVAVEKTAFAFDSLFTYEIPAGTDIKAGMRVIVPFGRADKHRIGVVFAVTDEKPVKAVKQIFAAADDGTALAVAVGPAAVCQSP